MNQGYLKIFSHLREATIAKYKKDLQDYYKQREQLKSLLCEKEKIIKIFEQDLKDLQNENTNFYSK